MHALFLHTKLVTTIPFPKSTDIVIRSLEFLVNKSKVHEGVQGNTGKPGCNDTGYKDDLAITISLYARVISPYKSGCQDIVS